MLRKADAAGVTAVIATDSGTDWANPNVVRASKGAVYAVAVVSADTAEVLAWLADRDIPVLAATPDATAVYTALHQLLTMSLIDSVPCRTGYSRVRVHRPGIGNRSTLGVVAVGGRDREEIRQGEGGPDKR